MASPSIHFTSFLNLTHIHWSCLFLGWLIPHHMAWQPYQLYNARYLIYDYTTKIDALAYSKDSR